MFTTGPNAITFSLATAAGKITGKRDVYRLMRGGGGARQGVTYHEPHANGVLVNDRGIFPLRVDDKVAFRFAFFDGKSVVESRRTQLKIYGFVYRVVR